MQNARCMRRTALPVLAFLLLVGVARAEEPPTTVPPTTQPAGPAPTTQPSLIDQIKQPARWFKWGADYRLRWEYIDNGFTLNKHTNDDEWNWQRSRPRVWTTLSPAPGLDLNTRFMWESRHFCRPHSREDWDWQDGVFDIMNVRLKVPNTPVTFTVGRQEIILGDGWLVLEGTPLDGSRSIFFDAARMTLDLKEIKTTADVIAIQNFSDTDKWLPPVDDQDIHVIEQDESGGILYVSNKSIDKTTLDGYFIGKHDHAVLANGDNGDIYTFGGRVVRDWTDHISTRVEEAGQFGHKNGQSVCALGLNSRATYFFRDPLKNQLRLSYEYLSGDDPATRGRNEAFDPLWGRWPQWSELYIYPMASETRIAEMTNHHRLAFGWQADPTDKLSISTDYHLLWADENTYRGRAGFSEHDRFRGQLLAAILRYKFTAHLTGHVMGETYWPGDYFEAPKGDMVAYFRMELMWTF